MDWGALIARRSFEKVGQVEELLLDPDTPERKRLLDASRQFLVATRYDEEWPTELQDMADAIKARLLGAGSPEASVSAMDPATVQDTTEEMLLFVKLAEVLLMPASRPRLDPTH